MGEPLLLLRADADWLAMRMQDYVEIRDIRWTGVQYIIEITLPNGSYTNILSKMEWARLREAMKLKPR